MRILTLIENTRNTKKLYAEHGLSFFIELNGKKILMDSGASDKFIRNAAMMRADIAALDAAVISHNHYDHTGGLEGLFKICPNIKVFAKKDVAGNYYRKIGPFNIVICWNKHFLNRHRDNFVLFTQFQEVCEGFYVMGCEVFNEDNMLRDRRLLKKEKGRYEPDDFKHEIFAAAFPHKEREKGCVVISSCSHSGIVNILETVKLTWPESPIIGVIGGFHLQNVPGVSEAFIKHTANELSRLSSGCVYTCHCTGAKAYERLKSHMGDQIQTLRTGEELSFD
ncbi:MAG: MBL fold metallo-hydrolase [Oscillospiraceae bacterium]|nr:MBL fold metallo-hydrolase [Oscillospiraceae bacterium]